MTTEQIKAHYRAVMCKTIEAICNKTLGRLPVSGEKVGILARRRYNEQKLKLEKALEQVFEVTVYPVADLGYDEICTAVWSKVEARIPYWLWIFDHAKDFGLVDCDAANVLPWERYLDELDLAEFCMSLEERYDIDMQDLLNDEFSMNVPSPGRLVKVLMPIIDDLGGPIGQ